jgi:hypothetical protein
MTKRGEKQREMRTVIFDFARTNETHQVDSGRPTKNFSADEVDGTVGEVGLRERGKAPVVVGVTPCRRGLVGERNKNTRIVGTVLASFDHTDCPGGVLGQSGRECVNSS